MKPYRFKYFLHISDPNFFEKMEKIIWLYLNAPKYLFCLDECTGLQVLERLAPKLNAQREKPELREFDYKRHGTVSILSILEVSNGKVFTDCIPNHTSSTILESLKKHISMYPPSETLHYICDNYSSHSTEEFCREIAALCNVTCHDLNTLTKRKQWLESKGKRIVFHFLPFHGSWLNQIEIWFGILQKKALKDESFSSVSACMQAIMDFTDTYNTHFSHPFKWSYKGDGLYEKVVRRLTTWVLLESSEMSYKFFTKQLLLMNNLMDNYSSKIKREAWVNLHKTIEEKDQYCWNIVNNINIEDFKDMKGSKGASDEQRNLEVNIKIKEAKQNLTSILSAFKIRLSEKLAVS